MRVVVLGAGGMLGHVVARQLSETGHEVVPGAVRYDPAAPGKFLDALRAVQPAAVVNCIGVHPGGGADESLRHAVNATLPALVAQSLAGSCRFVHASSDAVFAPHQAARRVEEPGDSTEAYGRGKWEAELAVRAAGGLVIRTSILGPELGPPRSLMGWFLGQQGSVNGFANHAWNGITTLEWARVCARALNGDLAGRTVCQPGFWPASNKAEVLRLMGEVWQSPVTVRAVTSPAAVARTLVPDIVCPPLRQQLLELRAWYPG